MNLSQKNYAIRGLLIILVVTGHVLTKNPHFYGKYYIYIFIYTFHMPLFLILSGYYGYTIVFKTYSQVIKSSLISLIIPFLVVSEGYMLVSHFLSGTKIRHNFFESPTFAMWFILALVFYRLTTKVIIKLPYYIFFVGLVSLFADYFPRALLDVGDFPRIFSFMIYYFIGVRLRETNYDLRKLIVKPQYVIVGFMLVSVFIILLNINYYQPVADLLRQTDVDFFRSLTVSQYLISRVLAMFLALINGMLIYSIIRPQKWLIYIGTRSLSIYLGHVFFILILKTSTYQNLIKNLPMPILMLIIGMEITSIIGIILFVNNKYQVVKNKVLITN